MIAPDFRNDPRQRTGDNPANARGIGIKRGGRTRLSGHQVLEIEHADTGQDTDKNGVQRL